MKQYRISEIFQHTENVKVIRLESLHDDHFNFQPGQYIDISFAGNHNKKDRDYTSFSITSLPSNKEYIEFSVLASGTFRQKIFNAAIGTILNISGPYGDFVYKHRQDLYPVFIAGGSGIAPVISMLRHINHKFTRTEFRLFYTCKSKNNIIFFNELNNLCLKNRLFRCNVVITRKNQYNNFDDRDLTESLDEEKNVIQTGLHLTYGRIDESMIVNWIKDKHSTVFYICGPYEMVIMLRFILQKLGVERDNIKSELWS